MGQEYFNKINGLPTNYNIPTGVYAFQDSAEATAWATANPSLAYNGLMATIGGSAVVWRDGVRTNPNSPYVGSTIPASGSYIGQLIQVANAAVPSGRSLLRWNGTIWAPPAGELIAAAAPTSETPIALVTPAVLTLVKIWESPVIPDYMIPNLLEWDIVAALGVQNAVSQAASVLLGVGCAGSIPTSTNSTDYPAQRNDAPNAAVHTGVSSRRSYFQTRRGGAFKTSNTDSFRTSYDYAGWSFVAGNSKLYAMAKPGHVSDQIRFDAAYCYSRGNL